MASIRCRLLCTLIALFAVGWLFLVVFTYVVAKQRIESLFDAHLDHDAGVLLTLLRNTGTGTQRIAWPKGERFRLGMDQDTRAFQVWRSGRLLLQSSAGRNFSMPHSAGYSDQKVGDHRWRLFALHDPQHQLIVQVGEPYSVRDRLVLEITEDAFFPLLLSLPLVTFAIWAGIGRGLKPLTRVAEEVEQRSPSYLKPVDLKRVPNEIQILTKKLNALLGLLRDAFERERQFTADAAHEIRTPLAAIKTHAQLALRARDDEQAGRALGYIADGVDRTSHLVEQLLTLARLDRESLEAEFVDVDLPSVVSEVVSGMQLLSQTTRVSLEWKAADGCRVWGTVPGLRILIRNLLDNALRYTPAGGRVRAGVVCRSDGVVFTVDDSGTGIPESQRERVFDRFHRGNAQIAHGCGLGLSIVHRIAELHGALIELRESPMGGLRVVVWFERRDDFAPDEPGEVTATSVPSLMPG